MNKTTIKLIATLVSLLMAGLLAQASNTTAPDSTGTSASLQTYVQQPSSSTGAGVTITQSNAISNGVSAHIKKNSSRKINGYRIRIFFDNKQSSRAKSESILASFRSAYPDIPAYRSYDNPYFKVTVGDFRTRSEALAVLDRIKGDFPLAFLVKENIRYPSAVKNISE